jgi:uncharacterized protein (TIGR02453 family)
VIPFEGFSDTGLELLDLLPSLDREGFGEIRSTYEAELLTPAKSFVVALGERLQEEVSPGLIAEPKVNGSLSPINNDLRFNPNKSPYKEHLLFNFWEGTPKKLDPTHRVRLTTTMSGFATWAAFDKAGLARWRSALDGPTGKAFASISDELADELDADVAGQELKRVPAPYDATHQRADLLRFKGYQFRWQEELPGSVNSPEFPSWCVERLQRVAPIHLWFVELLV